ncbi:hypothetical protein EVG20_g7998 [Dentipellis fragilis]|uniref:Peptidase S1 domain-containing protein n=1 Tax=Dentipellis fragilis TaxID=205917 RepID=A0A4Y9YBA0_9AGAM|nr:hypothetical protein EVG20_g7998 [Dentipellis fragilis]
MDALALDPSKLATAFDHIKDEAPQYLYSPVESGGGSPSELLSGNEQPTMPDSIPFMVTESVSWMYYRGLPSGPRLITTTNPDPYQEPTGLEAYPIVKELRELGDHPLVTIWDHGVVDGLRHGLNAMCVKWTSIDAVRIAEVGEPSDLAIVWIGVEPGALSFEEGSAVAHQCRMFIDRYGIPDFHVEIRVSRVVRQAGNRFLDPVPSSDTTLSIREPFTATLGIPISTQRRPWTEGTGGLYISTGNNDDQDIYLVTARHVVLPVGEDDNTEYERTTSKAREDVIVLGSSGFNEKLASIDNDIRGQTLQIIHSEEADEGMDDPMGTLRHEIVNQWGTKERRVIGEITWAPPVVFSTAPGQYTLDLAVIKIDAGKLDTKNYRGNSIGLGTNYMPTQFLIKVKMHPASSARFEFPLSRIVALQDQVPETDLAKPPMLDVNNNPCFIVFKNGGKTGMTIGRANRVSSYTRNYLAGQYHESREWPIIPTDLYRGAFSDRGDSGSCVADVFNRVGGIITGGAFDPKSHDGADVTYVTPISVIMNVLHRTERFKHAHLNPVLA